MATSTPGPAPQQALQDQDDSMNSVYNTPGADTTLVGRSVRKPGARTGRSAERLEAEAAAKRNSEVASITPDRTDVKRFRGSSSERGRKDGRGRSPGFGRNGSKSPGFDRSRPRGRLPGAKLLTKSPNSGRYRSVSGEFRIVSNGEAIDLDNRKMCRDCGTHEVVSSRDYCPHRGPRSSAGAEPCSQCAQHGVTAFHKVCPMSAPPSKMEVDEVSRKLFELAEFEQVEQPQ